MESAAPTDSRFARVLLVDVQTELALPTVQVATFRSYVEAMRALPLGFDALVARARLDGEGCLELVRQAHAVCPQAELVAFDTSCTTRALWEMRNAGLTRYCSLGRGMSVEQIVMQVSASIVTKQHFEHIARGLVGLEDLKAAQDLLRRIMFEEAFTRTGGNKRATARLLGVTRAAVQKIARSHDPSGTT